LHVGLDRSWVVVIQNVARESEMIKLYQRPVEVELLELPILNGPLGCPLRPPPPALLSLPFLVTRALKITTIYC